MERIDRDTYRLSTGREFYANHGLISIAENEDSGYANDPSGFEVGEGYDGHLDLAQWDRPDEDWTPAERIELADFMIGQWTAFKAKAAEPAKAGASQELIILQEWRDPVSVVSAAREQLAADVATAMCAAEDVTCPFCASKLQMITGAADASGVLHGSS